MHFLPEPRMDTRVETTDGRYVRIAENVWWDTTGVLLVSDRAVEIHMEVFGVGVAVINEICGHA